MRLPPLRSLQVFISAAKHLNFTRAAEELFVTHVSVSLQIKQLEEYLDVKLFRKVGRKLELTEFAKEYADHLQAAFEQMEQATENFLLANEHDNVLNIVVPNILAMRWLMPKLSEFQAEYPHIEVRLSSPSRKIKDQIRKLEQGSADLVISLDIDLPEESDQLQRDILFAEELVMVCHPDDPVAQSRELTFDSNLLMMDIPYRRALWRKYLEAFDPLMADLDKFKIMVCQDSNQVIHAAANGLGVGLVNHSYAKDLIELERLTVPIDISISGGRYVCLTTSSHQHHDKIQIFRNWLLSLV